VTHPLLTTCLVAAVSCLSMPAQGQGQCEAQTGSVSGYVTDGRGEPIPAAIVTLVKSSSNDKPITRTVTDGDGLFVMTKVPFDAYYHVRATAPGHIIGYDWVKVTKDEPRDTATIRLWSGGTIRGRVLSEEGEPVAGADVTAAFDVARGFGFDPQAVTTTDKDGNYTLRKVPLGYIAVRAVAPGRALVTENVYLRDTAKVDLKLKEEKGVDLVVKVAGLKEGEAEGVSISVLAYKHGSAQALPRRLVYGKTDKTGTWVTRGLPDMELRVSVNRKDLTFTPRTHGFNPIDKANQRRGIFQLAQANRKKVKGASTKGNTHTAVFQGVRNGTVALHGVLTGPDKKPLAGQTVVCRASNGGRTSTAVTDAEGRFRMDAPLGPGTRCNLYLTGSDYVLAQEPDAKEGRRARSLSLRSMARGRYDTTVDGQRTYELKAVRGVVVKGRFVTKDGSPVRFQRVLLQDHMANRTPQWFPVAYGRTDKDGRFVFRLRKIDPDLRVFTSGMGGYGHSEPFQLEAGETVDVLNVVVKTPASVEGVVKDANGDPLPGARIWLRDWDFQTGQQRSGSVVEVITDRQGRYRFRGVAPHGHYLQVHVKETRSSPARRWSRTWRSSRRTVQRTPTTSCGTP
jgi:hypothetical protein